MLYGSLHKLENCKVIECLKSNNDEYNKEPNSFENLIAEKYDLISILN